MFTHDLPLCTFVYNSCDAAGNEHARLSRRNSCADNVDGSTGGSGGGGGGRFDGR